MPFSQSHFFTKRRHLKELQVKENLFHCPLIWTVASLRYKKQKCICKFFISKYFFFKSDFCTIAPYFFDLILKMFCNFSLKLNMANCRQIFLALWVQKLRDTLNKRKIKFALTCSFQKMIRVFTFRGGEKFNNSFYFKNSWYSLMASSISFNLI